MTDLSKKENEDLLTVHPEDLAVVIDEDPSYNPHEESNVVVIEPPVISIGRAQHVKDLRKMRSELS